MKGKARKKIVYPYEYDPEKRRKAKAYTRVKIISGLVNGFLVPLTFLLAFFFSGASFLAAGAVGFLPLFVFLVLTLLNIVTFPLSFYSGYFYERKYGLSAYTLKGWFADYLKGLLIGYVMGVILLTLVYSFLGVAWWWVYAGILYFFVGVFLSTIWPALILPFFYKLSPFKDKALEKRLREMLTSAGVKNVGKIMVAKESEKSTKANALFAGMGKTKRMVLFDTLLDNFTRDEVETVIGHEMGHYVNKDIWRDVILSTVVLFPIFYIVHLTLLSAGVSPLNALAGLPLFLAAFNILELILMPFHNAYSRWRERAADWFGLEASKKPGAQISTEKRLADMALSDHRPHPLVEFLLYTHPAAEKRIRMVREWEGKKRGKGTGKR